MKIDMGLHPEAQLLSDCRVGCVKSITLVVQGLVDDLYKSTDRQSGIESVWAVVLSGNQRWENIVRLNQRVLDKWRNTRKGSNQKNSGSDSWKPTLYRLAVSVGRMSLSSGESFHNQQHCVSARISNQAALAVRARAVCELHKSW